MFYNAGPGSHILQVYDHNSYKKGRYTTPKGTGWVGGVTADTKPAETCGKNDGHNKDKQGISSIFSDPIKITLS